MDSLEQAFEEEQSRLDRSIKQTATSAVAKTEATGYCLNCYEDISDGQLFCNGKCADAFHAKQKFAVAG